MNRLNYLLVILLGMGIFLFGSVTSAHAWLNGYSYRKTVTVQADNIDENLTDFPLHIFIDNDSDIGGGMQDTTNYNDIRFTDTNDTVLPYEEESMIISGGVAVGHYWINNDLDNTNGATIYVYYGNSGASDGSSTGVWNNGYQGVWHLNEGDSTTTDFFQDSTVNNNHGTLTDTDGDLSQVNGQVGQAVDFTGEDNETDRINVGNDSSLDLGSTFTLSAWVNVDQHNSRDSGYGFIIAKDENPGGGSYDLGFRNNKPYVAINTNPTGLSWSSYSVDNDLPTNSWYYLAGVRNSDNSLDIYLNGQPEKSFTGVSTPATSTTDVTLGLRSVDALELDATIDEVRIENVSRSAAWIKFAYANMGGQPDDELVWGSQSLPATPTPTTTPNPTATTIPTPTSTPTTTATPSPTTTPTITPVPTPTPTTTPTPTSTPTTIATSTQTPTETPTPNTTALDTTAPDFNLNTIGTLAYSNKYNIYYYDQQKPALKGTGEKNTHVMLRVNGVTVQEKTIDVNSSWIIDEYIFPIGVNSVQFTATDQADNQTLLSLTLTIDPTHNLFPQWLKDELAKTNGPTDSSNSTTPSPTPTLTPEPTMSSESTPTSTTPEPEESTPTVTPTQKTSEGETPGIQGNKLSVKITDQENKPLAGIEVKLPSDNTKIAKTDDAGIAIFENVAPGDHEVEFSYKGKTLGRSVTLLNDEQEYEINFEVTVETDTPKWIWGLLIILFTGFIITLYFAVIKRDNKPL